MTVTYNSAGHITGFSYDDINALYRSGAGQTLVFDMDTYMAASNSATSFVRPTSFAAYQEVADYVRQTGQAITIEQYYTDKGATELGLIGGALTKYVSDNTTKNFQRYFDGDFSPEGLFNKYVWGSTSFQISGEIRPDGNGGALYDGELRALTDGFQFQSDNKTGGLAFITSVLGFWADPTGGGAPLTIQFDGTGRQYTDYDGTQAALDKIYTDNYTAQYNINQAQAGQLGSSYFLQLGAAAPLLITDISLNDPIFAASVYVSGGLPLSFGVTILERAYQIGTKFPNIGDALDAGWLAITNIDPFGVFSLSGTWINNARTALKLGADESITLTFEQRWPDNSVTSLPTALSLGWLSSAAVGGLTVESDGTYRYNLSAAGNVLVINPDSSASFVTGDLQTLRNWGIGELGAIQQSPSGAFTIGQVVTATSAGSLLAQYTLDLATGALTATGATAYVAAPTSVSWTAPSAAQVAADAATLQGAINAAVAVANPTGPADNSLLSVGGLNWSGGAPQQQMPVIQGPTGTVLYGIYQGGGAFFAGTPNINDDGLLAVGQNYILTGNVNPGRQQVQADKDNIAKRLGAGRKSSDGSTMLPEIVVRESLSLSGFQAQSPTVKNIDPLVLDLDGDGIELSDWMSRNVFFDMLGDGKLHQTGWAAGGDGILALDVNGNGVIDDITEMLSVSFKGGTFADGLAALASLATSGATVFSARDPR